ncbi:glutamate 5-kinase [Campylobacter sp. MG1]|uniref:glutamate 5-kinase n=1 Tax=Campylobacter sp. MG1 TaxID=2976332 RepID=UPI00226D33BB|nr:glutamate 5-kinase [Campylobacter sp. MG1]
MRRIDYKRIVIKIGTTSLTYANGKINLRAIENLAWVLCDLKNQGKEIILVSSGAIAVGTERLALEKRPRDIVGKQVASAVGQGVLMQIYESFFSKYNQIIAQILLTRDVFENEIMLKNAQNSVLKLIQMGVIPIVNENDTVATDELQGFSDNDTLSAYVSNLVDADLLILLSDIDAMYDKDPNKFSDAKKISEIYVIDDEVLSSASGSNSALGTGGMITKVNSAKMVNGNGIDMIITSGKDFGVLFDIVQGKEIGTLFKGSKNA